MGKNGIGIWLNCQWCGEAYRVTRSRYGRSKYCSRSCKGASNVTELNATPKMRELSRTRLEALRKDPAFAEAQSAAAAEALRRVITDMTVPGGKGHPMPIPQRTGWPHRMLFTTRLQATTKKLPAWLGSTRPAISTCGSAVISGKYS